MERQDIADTPEPHGKRSALADLVIPGAGLAFTLYYLSTIIDSPWAAQAGAVFVAAILVLLILLVVARTVRAAARGEAAWNFESLVAPRELVARRLALLMLTLGYAVVIRWGGFTLTTFVFLTAAMLLLNGGRKVRFVTGLATGLALAGYLLFILAFKARLPLGPFEALAATLVGG